MTEPQNREAWLIAAAEAMIPWFTELDLEVPPLRVSVGWPGGNGRKSHVIGQCWPSTSAADGVAQIFVTPGRGEEHTVEILGTLLHEMIHAVDDCESGHRGGFIKIARPLGFVPRWTSSENRSDELTERLTELGESLGPIPHAALSASARGSEEPKKQGTRMIKLVCSEDDYTVRTTRKHIDNGLPTCPCGNQMEEA